MIPVEDLDGLLLVSATLRGSGGRDTTGPMVLDTGASHLALDRHLAVALGLADSLTGSGGIEYASRPLPRLALGALESDQVFPVLSIDADVIRRVTDRDVLGLIGQRTLAPYLVWIDYPRSVLAFLPAGETRPGESARSASRRALSRLTTRARAVPFRIAGDGKLLIRARLTDARGRTPSAPLTLVLDTGASKTVLFEPALVSAAPASARWKALDGLAAPTLFGTDEARIVRVPRLVLESADGPVEVRDMDAATMAGELPRVLERVMGEPVHGVLGYTFLRRFRVALDFGRRLVWLDPVNVTTDTRANEYSNIGIQVERVDGELLVVAVARPTPASEAAIARGDAIEAIDGRAASGLDVMAAIRLLEGPPGSRVSLVLRRDGSLRTLVLTRRRLL